VIAKDRDGIGRAREIHPVIAVGGDDVACPRPVPANGRFGQRAAGEDVDPCIAVGQRRIAAPVDADMVALHQHIARHPGQRRADLHRDAVPAIAGDQVVRHLGHREGATAQKLDSVIGIGPGGRAGGIGADEVVLYRQVRPALPENDAIVIAGPDDIAVCAARAAEGHVGVLANAQAAPRRIHLSRRRSIGRDADIVALHRQARDTGIADDADLAIRDGHPLDRHVIALHRQAVSIRGIADPHQQRMPAPGP